MVEKIVRGINTILLTTSISLNILFILLLFHFYNDFNNRIIYDIDKARKQYKSSVFYFVHQACLYGIDYPQEYKDQANVGYFEKGPGSYCNEVKNNLYFQIEEDANALGKGNQ